MAAAPAGAGRGRGARGRGGPGAPQVGTGAAAAAAKRARAERRWAPDGTGPYTKQEFAEYYAGTDMSADHEWEQAAPAPSAAPLPKRQATAAATPTQPQARPAPLPLTTQARLKPGPAVSVQPGRPPIVKMPPPAPSQAPAAAAGGAACAACVRGWPSRGPPRGAGRFFAGVLRSTLGDDCGICEMARDQTAVWFSFRSPEGANAFVQLINVQKAYDRSKFPQLKAVPGERPPAAAPAAPAARGALQPQQLQMAAAAPARGRGRAAKIAALDLLPAKPGGGAASWGLAPPAAAPVLAAAAAGPVEKRYAADGTGPYTKQQFEAFYRNTQWDADREWQLAGVRQRKAEKKAAALQQAKAAYAAQQQGSFGVAAEMLARKSSRMARFGSSRAAAPAVSAADERPWQLREGEEFDEAALAPIVGQCAALEKAFTRSAAGLTMDPTLVRPVPVLRRALRHVLWRQSGMKRERRLIYCREQLKSIRQDLTVQHVLTPFTTEVYEAHARICIEHGDRGEFVICLAKLGAFHARAETATGLQHAVEFAAYRILYLAITRQEEKLCAEIAALTPELRASGPVRHALAVVRALSPLSLWRLRALCRDAPFMGRALMKLFMRPPHGLVAAVWPQLLQAYKPKVPSDWLRQALLFDLGPPVEATAAQWRYKGGALAAAPVERAEDPPEAGAAPGAGALLEGDSGDEDSGESDEDEDGEGYEAFLQWAKAVVAPDGCIEAKDSLTAFRELQSYLRTRRDFHESDGRIEFEQ
eukprot:TRINITY_DN6756_c2_g1_i1.p1 TRINITY_DN6756_c2_g1~~TRINITY_DN6756_c2_g1_i1.p1  ORF type:complete len:759 (+),score=262.52 TRINITY_DN6756_c2_g1_i1:69-2345(+)